MHAAQVGQPQFQRHLLHKRGLFAHRVHTGHRQAGATNSHHHAGQARAGAHVQQTPACGQPHRPQLPLQWRNGRQAVEHMVRQHAGRVAQGGEVVDLVPLLDQGQITLELLLLCRQQIHPHLLGGMEDIGCSHHSLAKAAVLKPCFFKCTISSEMAAGVTPDILDARPSVSGRCLFSVWRTSKLSAATCM